MSAKTPSELLKEKFPFTPTPDQLQAFQTAEQFLTDRTSTHPLMLLRGYAGTGKTTLLGALVSVIKQIGFNVVMLAPTGRAAKVMSNYSNVPASTIHRHIYNLKKAESGSLFFAKKNNQLSKTVFIVDEASMIGEESEGGNSLLSDLFDYVYSKPLNRIILTGDNAQLPPVGFSSSPALSAQHLKERYMASVFETELTEVVRQQQASGILHNATKLRDQMQAGDYTPQLRRGFKDFYLMGTDKLEDGIRYAYDKFGQNSTVIITRTNKLATAYNKYIRHKIHFQENEINAGDLLLIVRNNYQVITADSPAGFLANGDFAEVKRIVKFEDRYGFRFAWLELTLPDNPDQPAFQAPVFLDLLYSDQAQLSQEQNRSLYEQLLVDYAEITNKRERAQAIQGNSYYSALQVKFAYALTCHKAQGGQWDAVFVDHGWLPPDYDKQDFCRWMYTAITRAVTQSFMINVNELFVEKEE
jgi:ATP-dependent exoDNAse (exonuclease V) alpha subunit